MKVLIACEYSQIVTQAFRDKGHEAFSCDILPTEGNPSWHYQGNVFDIINDNWDLMIAHPPCTYLSYAGIKYWNDDGRKEKRDQALDFFMKLYNAPIPKVAVENPVGYPNTIFRKPDQIVKPYYFGESEQKNICLWLKGLPKLVHIKSPDLFLPVTHVAKPLPKYIDKSGRQRYFADSICGWNKNAKKTGVVFLLE
jgi:hypothetical protein